MERSGAFDYILLETTGLADPGNIAPLFWVDEGLGSTIYLDGIVTLVDAKNVLRSLEEPEGEEVVGSGDEDRHDHESKHLSIAHLQISHADVVVLNKADLVTTEELKAVEARVRSINALAKVQVTDHSQVPSLEGLVLNLHAYDNVTAESLEFASKGHSHLDPAIGTITLDLPSLDDSQFDKLDEWLRALLWENKLLEQAETKASWEVHRIKGRIARTNAGTKMLQGVREIFEFIDTNDTADSSTGTSQSGKIVLIGRNLTPAASTFQQSLDASLNAR